MVGLGVVCSPGAYIGQGEADNTQANKHKNQITLGGEKCVLKSVQMSSLYLVSWHSVLAFLNSKNLEVFQFYTKSCA